MNRRSAAESIMKAAHNYCAKIDWVMEHNPEDTGELACLYAGISGINECIKTLSDDGIINGSEGDTLERELNELLAHCQVRKSS